ncbi:MAG: type IV pilus twitching motility protein PilT [Planctomycetota bacterium]|jgi:twitching motility protein PilT
MSEANIKQSKLVKLLAQMEKLGASDLHIKSFSPPIFRIHGVPRRIESPPVSNEEIESMIQDILTADQSEVLGNEGNIDLALGISEVGRFRVNIYRQRGSFSFCARRVNSQIPDFENLNLPKAINRVPAFEDGLALIVGATGSGKSTTLASIISRINQQRRCHILTIEDPIEYMYKDDKAFINQREVGLDVDNFNSALKFALRQDPDVILVGELRDSDTIETAMAASETGHLVFATLHANNAMQTISRILDFFPGERQNQIRQMLAFTLRSVIAQKLVPGCKKEFPRLPAIELMFINGVIKKLIQENEDGKIPEAIRSFAKEGFQDFNMSLFNLEKQGLITQEVALDHSPNPEQLRMNFKGMVLNQDQSAM